MTEQPAREPEPWPSGQYMYVPDGVLLTIIAVLPPGRLAAEVWSARNVHSRGVWTRREYAAVVTLLRAAADGTHPIVTGDAAARAIAWLEAAYVALTGNWPVSVHVWDDEYYGPLRPPTRGHPSPSTRATVP
jgi:hypothetical protein